MCPLLSLSPHWDIYPCLCCCAAVAKAIKQDLWLYVIQGLPEAEALALGSFQEVAQGSLSEARKESHFIERSLAICFPQKMGPISCLLQG